MTTKLRARTIIALAALTSLAGLVRADEASSAPGRRGPPAPEVQPDAAPAECEGECEEPCETCDPPEEQDDGDDPSDTPPPKIYGEDLDHLVIGYRFYTAPSDARKRLAKKEQWLEQVNWWVDRINNECASHGLHIDRVVEDQQDDTKKLVADLADIDAMIAEIELGLQRRMSNGARRELERRKKSLEANRRKFERAAKRAEAAKQAGKRPPKPAEFQSILFFATDKAAAELGANAHQWIVGHDELREKLGGHRSPRVFHFALFEDVHFIGKKSGWGPGVFGPPNLMAAQYAGKPGAPKSMKHEVGHLFGLLDHTGGIMDKPYGDESRWSPAWCPTIIAHLR